MDKMNIEREKAILEAVKNGMTRKKYCEGILLFFNDYKKNSESI